MQFQERVQNEFNEAEEEHNTAENAVSMLRGEPVNETTYEDALEDAQLDLTERANGLVALERDVVSATMETDTCILQCNTKSQELAAVLVHP